MSSQNLLGQLQAFALNTKTSSIDVNQFMRTLPGERLEEIESGVKELAYKGALTLEAQDGRPAVISFPDFPVLALVDAYRKLIQDPQQPFPREDTAPVPIPPDQLLAMDARGQLGELFTTESLTAPPVIKLIFPEGVPSLVVPRACSRAELIDAAIARIGRSLQDIKNAQYVESKLAALLKGSEMTMRQALDDLSLRPRKAAATILVPTEFSFRFWNHLANIIIQDTGRKTELTELDKGLLQSAYIVMYTVFHMKGEAQREIERAADRKALEQQLRRAPFVFNYQDLYDLRDEKGTPYSQKHSRDFIHEFLNESLQKKEDTVLPWLLRLYHAPTDKDYFVQRDMLAPVFLKKLTDISDALRVEYVKEWVEQMRHDGTPPVTLTDTAFRRHLEARVRDTWPVLAALANGPILFALLASAPLDDDTELELRRCFTSTGSMKSMPALLGLSRTRLLREARSYLPFWQTAPVIRGIARFLRMLFRGRTADGEAPARAALPAGAAAPAGGSCTQGGASAVPAVHARPPFICSPRGGEAGYHPCRPRGEVEPAPGAGAETGPRAGRERARAGLPSAHPARFHREAPRPFPHHRPCRAAGREQEPGENRQPGLAGSIHPAVHAANPPGIKVTHRNIRRAAWESQESRWYLLECKNPAGRPSESSSKSMGTHRRCRNAVSTRQGRSMPCAAGTRSARSTTR